MATADSVREKIERLISDANAATGNTDSDLTAAVNALIAGYGQGADTSAEDAIITRTLTEYSNDRVTKIGDYAFYGNKSMKSASFPNVTTIGEGSFNYCNSLEIFNFPKLTSIAYSALRNCISLTSLDFSELTSISYTAFANCTNLCTFILRSNNVCNLSEIQAFTNTPINSGTGYIYVPSTLIDTYKTATNWVTFADQFRALEDYTIDGTTTGELDESKVNV